MLDGGNEVRTKEVWDNTFSAPSHIYICGEGWAGLLGHVTPFFNSSCTWWVCRSSWLMCLECSFGWVLSRCPIAQGVSKFPEGGIVTLPGPPPKSHTGPGPGSCCRYRECSPSSMGRALDKVSGKSILGPAFLLYMRRSTKGSPRSLLWFCKMNWIPSGVSGNAGAPFKPMPSPSSSRLLRVTQAGGRPMELEQVSRERVKWGAQSLDPLWKYGPNIVCVARMWYPDIQP